MGARSHGSSIIVVAGCSTCYRLPLHHLRRSSGYIVSSIFINTTKLRSEKSQDLQSSTEVNKMNRLLGFVLKLSQRLHNSEVLINIDSYISSNFYLAYRIWLGWWTSQYTVSVCTELCTPPFTSPSNFVQQTPAHTLDDDPM
jgi:hypothetical protein